jgi:hypothetical protein
MFYLKNAVNAIASSSNENARELISEDSIKVKSNVSNVFSAEGYSRFSRLSLFVTEDEYSLVIGKHRFPLSWTMDIDPKPFSLVTSSIPDDELHLFCPDGKFFYFLFSSSGSKENFQISLGGCLADLACMNALEPLPSGRLSIAKMGRCLEICQLLSAEERPLLKRLQEILSVRRRISRAILKMKNDPSSLSRSELKSLIATTSMDAVWTSDNDVAFLHRILEQSTVEDIEVLCKELAYDETEDAIASDWNWGEASAEPMVVELALQASSTNNNYSEELRPNLTNSSAMTTESDHDSSTLDCPVLAAVSWSSEPPVTPAKPIVNDNLVDMQGHVSESALHSQQLYFSPNKTTIPIEEVVASPVIEVKASCPLMNADVEMPQIIPMEGEVSTNTTNHVNDGELPKKQARKKKRRVMLNGIDLETLKQPIIASEATFSNAVVEVEVNAETVFIGSSGSHKQSNQNKMEVEKQVSESVVEIMEHIVESCVAEADCTISMETKATENTVESCVAEADCTISMETKATENTVESCVAEADCTISMETRVVSIGNDDDIAICTASENEVTLAGVASTVNQHFIVDLSKGAYENDRVQQVGAEMLFDIIPSERINSPSVCSKNMQSSREVVAPPFDSCSEQSASAISEALCSDIDFVDIVDCPASSFSSRKTKIVNIDAKRISASKNPQNRNRNRNTFQWQLVVAAILVVLLTGFAAVDRASNVAHPSVVHITQAEVFNSSSVSQLLPMDEITTDLMPASLEEEMTKPVVKEIVEAANLHATISQARDFEHRGSTSFRVIVSKRKSPLAVIRHVIRNIENRLRSIVASIPHPWFKKILKLKG